MRNQEVERAVTALNTTDGRDISGITRQIQDLQRNPALWARERDAINDRVDMRRMGFAGNDDIQITGVDGEGRLLTRSSDGRSQQVRDGRTGTVITEQAVPSGRVTPNGERDFRDPDGSGSVRYTIRPGDTLSHVVRQRLRAETGAEPSLRDIHDQVQAIRQANPNTVRDVNNVRVGTEITIPSIRDRERPASAQGLREDNPSLDPRSAAYHPMRLPGQVDPARSHSANWREGSRTNDNTGQAGQRNIRSYDTTVREGGAYVFSSPPTAQVTQETDRRTGEVLRSSVRYGGDGINITMQDQSGTRNLQGVRSAETTMDVRTGGYSTTITTRDGTHVVTTDRTGRVTGWNTRS